MGMCMAPSADGGGSLQGLAGPLVSGLLGAAAGLFDDEFMASYGCMPAEPASLPEGEVPRTAGNPVDLISGAKLDRAIDAHLAMAGAAAGLGAGAPVELVFSRLYSSAGGGSAAFGPGWRHGFETRLHAGHDAAGHPQLQLLQADGRLLRFGGARPGLAGRPIHPALRREDGLLEREPGGAGAAEAGTADRAPGWIWHWPDGRRLRFDAQGWLVSIAGPEGGRLTLERAADGRLTAVQDAAGRRVRFLYDEGRPAAPPDEARIAALELPDGGRVRYGYDAHGRLASVRHPGVEAVRYAYDEGPGARLAAVVLPDGRRSAYRYDAAGRATYTRAAGADEARALRLEYLEHGPADAGETRLFRGGRLLASHRWRQSADDARPRMVASVRWPCAGCPAVESGYEYVQGRLVRMTLGEVPWRLLRDGQGRLAALERRRFQGGVGGGEAGSAEILLRMAWAADPWRDRLLSVSRPSVVAGRRHLLRFEYGPREGVLRIHESGFAPRIAMADGQAVPAGALPIRRSRQWLAGASAASIPDWRVAGPAPRLPAGARPEAHGRWAVPAVGVAPTRYWLDDFGRPVAMASPDSGLTRWGYDEQNRLTEERGADGAVARHQRDGAGRPVGHSVHRAGQAGTAARFRYEEGRLAAVDHAVQSERHAYDSRGRPILSTVSLRLATGRDAVFETRYRYEGDSPRPSAQTLPDGSWLEHRADAGGQVVALVRQGADGRQAMLAEALERDRHGLARARLGNGVRLSLARDASGRPLQSCHRGPAAAAGSCDLLDHRTVFDVAGRLVAWRRGGHRVELAYDGERRLLHSAEHDHATGTTVARGFAYDGNGNRRMAWRSSLPRGVMPAQDGAELAPAPALGPAPARGPASTFAPAPAGSNRLLAPESAAAGGLPQWDAAGRLLSDHQYRYRWNAMGLLAEVSASGAVLARHRYNHRGQRVATHSADGWRYFLYDLQRRPLAELDDAGRLVRQYVYLGDAPLAVVDRQDGRERLSYLHLDHLGVPVLATDTAGRPLWRAWHAPFGRLLHREGAGFELPLRLPGQTEDPATGLHYNDHRWYDPETGRYLSPDPLGPHGGSNPYAYAGNDPLTRIDPSGLLLFAFDGTGNSDPPQRQDDWSNVYKFAQAYAGGRVWYMSGVGTSDAASGVTGGTTDALGAVSARARVDHMLAELERVAGSPQWADRWVDVDVIGFSRGAAMARDFANRVSDGIADGRWTQLGGCVRLRFLGLWDTVAQFVLGDPFNVLWRLPVPADVAYAAHAVALNEHRALFPVESIVGGPAGGTRIERGFIGAHSDIGGGYAEGDLSDVALGWMHAQAALAGVPMFALTSEYARVSSPLLHDSNVDRKGDRFFRIPPNSILASPPQRLYLQRAAPVAGMRWSQTAGFISRFEAPRPDAYGAPTLVGMVEMPAYSGWLSANYGFEVGW